MFITNSVSKYYISHTAILYSQQKNQNQNQKQKEIYRVDESVGKGSRLTVTGVGWDGDDR